MQWIEKYNASFHILVILQYESTNPKIDTCIRPLSEVLAERRHRLLGHVIRCESNDPMFQATFKDETLERFPAFYRRAGAPRQQWLESNMSTAWARIANRPAEDYEGSIEQVQNIKEGAILRKTPFNLRRHAQRDGRTWCGTPKSKVQKIGERPMNDR